MPIFNNQLATITYNGYEFSDITKSKFTMEAVPNEADTGTKYFTISIELEAIVHPEKTWSSSDLATDNGGVRSGTPANTDNAMETFREQLMKRGKELIIDEKGFGKIYVTPIPQKQIKTGEKVYNDVNFGPVPNVVMIETIGQAKAARIVWTCKANVIEITGQFATAAIDFEVTSAVKIKKNGYQILTRTGHAEVPSFERFTKIKHQFASKATLYNLMSPDSMIGYHLETDYSWSKNLKILYFTLTYTEIESENPYPLGVVDIKCSHSQGSELLGENPFRMAFKSWLNVMNCSITLRPGIPKLQAWLIFTNIASSRISEGIVVNITGIKNREPVAKIKVPIVLSLEVTEEIFANQVNFTIAWVTFSDSLFTVFSDSGMFKPIDGQWEEWTADMRLVAQNADGVYPLIRDGNSTVVISQERTLRTNDQFIPFVQKGRAAEYTPTIYSPNCPPEEASWLDYQNRFFVRAKAGRSTWNRYKTLEQIERGTYNPRPNDQSFKVAEEYNQAQEKADYFVQDMGNDRFKVQMRGYAIRLGYPTKPPEIKTIGGKEVRLIDDESIVTNRTLSAFSNCPTYVTTWDITYEVLGTPTDDMERERESTGEQADY